MATLRNKRKLAAVTTETQEEHLGIGQSRNTSVPRNNEEHITQVSEEIEGRVTKKLFQEFSRIESRILGALSKLDESLLNPQIRTHSGTVPGIFGNTNIENQGPNEDDSQGDSYPETGIFCNQTTHKSGPEVGHDTCQLHHFAICTIRNLEVLNHQLIAILSYNAKEIVRIFQRVQNLQNSCLLGTLFFFKIGLKQRPFPTVRCKNVKFSPQRV